VQPSRPWRPVAETADRMTGQSGHRPSSDAMDCNRR
jgi:hypothetical protein